MKHALISYCSENYLDAFKFVIPSWINTSCEKIIIYTDSKNFPQLHPKVKIVQLFEKSNEWIIGTGRRLDAIRYFIEKEKDYPYFTFLDMDCYVKKDYIDVFLPLENCNRDIAITRLFGENSGKTATAGVFFAKTNDNFKLFLNDWIARGNEIRLTNPKANRNHKVSYVQYSFTELMWKSFHEQKSYKVHVATEKIYNSEHDDIAKWLHEVKMYQPKILHFKGGRYKDTELVKRVFGAYK